MVPTSTTFGGRIVNGGWCFGRLQSLPVPYATEAATTLPSSKQWDSKHGAYCVPRLTKFDGDFTSDAGPSDALWSWAEAPGSGSYPKIGVSSPSKRTLSAHGTPFIVPAESVSALVDADKPLGALVGAGYQSDYTATGCHILGLDPKSTFTVVATYFVQILPRPTSSLVSLV